MSSGAGGASVLQCDSLCCVLPERLQGAAEVPSSAQQPPCWQEGAAGCSLVAGRAAAVVERPAGAVGVSLGSLQ